MKKFKIGILIKNRICLTHIKYDEVGEYRHGGVG